MLQELTNGYWMISAALTDNMLWPVHRPHFSFHDEAYHPTLLCCVVSKVLLIVKYVVSKCIAVSSSKTEEMQLPIYSSLARRSCDSRASMGPTLSLAFAPAGGVWLNRFLASCGRRKRHITEQPSSTHSQVIGRATSVVSSILTSLIRDIGIVGGLTAVTATYVKRH